MRENRKHVSSCMCLLPKRVREFRDSLLVLLWHGGSWWWLKICMKGEKIKLLTWRNAKRLIRMMSWTWRVFPAWLLRKKTFNNLCWAVIILNGENHIYIWVMSAIPFASTWFHFVPFASILFHFGSKWKSICVHLLLFTSFYFHLSRFHSLPFTYFYFHFLFHLVPHTSNHFHLAPKYRRFTYIYFHILPRGSICFHLIPVVSI